jgi:hypothetical protein
MHGGNQFTLRARVAPGIVVLAAIEGVSGCSASKVRQKRASFQPSLENQHLPKSQHSALHPPVRKTTLALLAIQPQDIRRYRELITC